MPPKSRAQEARRRRHVHREMRRIVLMATLGDSTSSDDNSPNTRPPAVPVQVQVMEDNSGTAAVMVIDENEVEPEAGYQPRASPIKKLRRQAGRHMRGRRLLYGPHRGDIVMSDETSANNESFSDNAFVNAHSDDERTDPETDNAFQGRPISSSEPSESISDRSDNEGDDGGLTLRERLALYVTRHALSVRATAELLALFKRAGVQGLPKDRRALLRTPRSLIGIVDKCGGQYKYLGLETGLVDLLQNNPTFVPVDNTISFNVNIDGVPLYKSSSGQFWPLLCCVGRYNPFVVALYYGVKKPNNISNYLEDFIEEYLQLCQLGLSYQGNRYDIRLRCWICDAPARSLLKCIKGHTGYFACERCKAKGVYIEKKVTYPARLVYESRTDNGFAAMAYHNAPDGDTHQNGEHCPLIDAQLNCVSGVVVDVMHNIYLGTWKRMLNFLIGGPRGVCRLSMNQKVQVNDKLLRLRLPREFSRQPRTIFELDRWKATELRSSLLYTGYIFLKGIVSCDMYELYLKLTVAMNILHTENDVRRNLLLNFARELLLEFVRDSQQLLGQGFIVYNVHCMSHIPDDVEKFQSSVNEFSAFPYENHLQVIKKMVKGPCNPLAQVCGRLAERAKQNYYQRGKIIQPFISTRMKDSMFYLDITREFVMIQRRRRRDNRYDVLVFSADQTEDFFQRPCPSRLVNVFLVRNLDNQRATPRVVTKDDLHHKVVLLPCDNGVDYLLIPMLHELEVDR